MSTQLYISSRNTFPCFIPLYFYILNDILVINTIYNKYFHVTNYSCLSQHSIQTLTESKYEITLETIVAKVLKCIQLPTNLTKMISGTSATRHMTKQNIDSQPPIL